MFRHFHLRTRVLHFTGIRRFSMKTMLIKDNDAGQRLDKFLAKAIPALPKALMHKYIRTKRIKLDGKRCDAGSKLVAGSELSLYIPDEFFSHRPLPFLAAPAELSVVYEDENLLLADKPPGLVVHEDQGGSADTLIGRIQHYLYQKGEYDPAREQSFAPALCNRIDRNTGGIVIAAKNFPTLTVLNQKIKDREISKLYLCLVHGTLRVPRNTLKGYHVKDAVTNMVHIHKEPVPGAKTALTKYRVLAARDNTSLVEVELLTGRTHQIRAHMASIGHPLVGDTKYGMNRMNKDGPRYQALYSYKITFCFKTDAQHLYYLHGKSFQVSQVPFADSFGKPWK